MPSEICVFSGQIQERTETEAGLLYEAKQVTAHRPHCSLWQGWTSYLLHVLHSGQTAFQVEQRKKTFTLVQLSFALSKFSI